jgi:hypothetical protein
MLDFPELFAPANSVSGRISIVCSSEMDLNPATESSVIVTGSWELPLDLVIRKDPVLDDSNSRPGHYHNNPRASEVDHSRAAAPKPSSDEARPDEKAAMMTPNTGGRNEIGPQQPELEADFASSPRGATLHRAAPHGEERPEPFVARQTNSWRYCGNCQ